MAGIPVAVPELLFGQGLHHAVTDFACLLQPTYFKITIPCHTFYHDHIHMVKFSLMIHRNMEVFDEIARTVVDGLRELGRDTVLVLCNNLASMCASESALGKRQV